MKLSLSTAADTSPRASRQARPLPVSLGRIALHTCLLLACTLLPVRLGAQILKFDASFGGSGMVGTLGSGPAEFMEPSGVAFDDSGLIYISDSENLRIQILNSDGTFASEIPILGNQIQTLDVAVNSQGRVYALASRPNAGVGEVQVFNSNGTHYMTFGSFGSAQGQFDTPRGLTIDNQDRVYVSDTENHRIQVFDTSGCFLDEFGTLGTGTEEFNFPLRPVVDSQGRIYVPELRNHRVQVLDATTGTHVSFIGQGPGSTPGELDRPTSVAVDQIGNVYIAEAGNNRIQVFDPSGSHIAFFGSFGTGTNPGEFDRPNDLAFDPAQKLVVANTFNQRVERYWRNEISPAVVFSLNSVWLKQNSSVLSGNVVVNDASPGPTLAAGVELTVGIGAEVAADSNIKANRIKVKQDAAVDSDVFYNQLDNNGAVNGVLYSPLPLPIADPPSFVPVTPGAADVIVPIGGFTTLLAGDYQDIVIKKNGTLVFLGGDYNIRSLNGGQSCKILFSDATAVHIAERFDSDKNSVIGPDTLAAIDASDIVFLVGGINGTSGNLGATPKATQIGLNNTVDANFYVPNGTLWIRQNTEATGAFLGKDVIVGIGASVSLNSAF